MTITIDQLNSCTDQKYTEFENIIKSELRSKMSNHDVLVNYTSEIDKIKEYKNIFMNINKDKGEE